MDRLVLSDADWDRMSGLIIGRPDQKGSTGRDDCMFVEGVLWIVRTGSPWRDLPEAFGDWNSAFRRFSRWSQKGVWRRIFEAMSGDPDFEYPIIDSTIVHAHQHATEAKKGAEDQALGRSRGGLSTKVHMAVRGLGQPVRFILTAGQRGDASQACPLIEGLPAQIVMADTVYDADHLRQAIVENGARGHSQQSLASPEIRTQPAPLRTAPLCRMLLQPLQAVRRVATRFEDGQELPGRPHLAASILCMRQCPQL